MSELTGASPLMGYLAMLRLGNCVMGALGCLLAAIVCGGVDALNSYPFEIILSMVTVFTFTAAGNSLNDYFDRETDKIAHPERPLPSGVVLPAGALIVSVILFALAVEYSYFVGIWSLAIVLTSVAIMAGYELLLKAEGFAGNLAISWLTGALFLFGGAAVEKMELAWILAALAFLATLGREIIKDIQDIEGDKGSRRTLPMRIGAERAGVVGSVAFIGAVVLSPLPYVQGLLSIWYVPVVGAADAIFIYCALIHFRSPRQGQKVAKLAMLVALLAFLLGGVF
jgi:geranylgeranylglycerol-phosphate geranylgeranyltransferase